MEIKGWEEVNQKEYRELPLQKRATITYSDPYKVVYIAETAGLEKLKQEDAERTDAETGDEGVEGDSVGAEDSEAQH